MQVANVRNSKKQNKNKGPSMTKLSGTDHLKKNMPTKIETSNKRNNEGTARLQAASRKRNNEGRSR
jgi:hypothetical protein